MSELLTDPQAEPELEAPPEPVPPRKVVRRRRALLLLSALALLLAGVVAWASQSAWLLGRVGDEVTAAVTTAAEEYRSRRLRDCNGRQPRWHRRQQRDRPAPQ